VRPCRAYREHLAQAGIVGALLTTFNQIELVTEFSQRKTVIRDCAHPS
jgi:hypothetical protein